MVDILQIMTFCCFSFLRRSYKTILNALCTGHTLVQLSLYVLGVRPSSESHFCMPDLNLKVTAV